MGLPRLQSCCLVLDLKTGNIVMGCLNAFLSFTMFIMMIVVAVMMDTATTGEDKIVAEQGTEKVPPFIQEIEVEQNAALAGFYAMSVILVLMFLAKFLFDLFFVYGVMSERRGAIKAYFIMWVVFFLLSMFVFSINLLNFDVGPIVMELVYIGINVYCILLSYSFYEQLNEREEV